MHSVNQGHVNRQTELYITTFRNSRCVTPKRQIMAPKQNGRDVAASFCGL